MNKLLEVIKFILVNFGPIVVFFAFNHFVGIGPAIGATILWTVAEILMRLKLRQPLSIFFILSAAITIVFGFIDLYLQKSMFIKYEAALTNFIIGTYFAASLLGKKTFIQEFAETGGKLKGEPSPDAVFYFRLMTSFWVLYQYLKAGFYVWVGLNYSLEEGLVIRGTVGNISFYCLLGISIFGSKIILGTLGKLHLTPSSKNR
jgi:intracellular septation protein A